MIATFKPEAAGRLSTRIKESITCRKYHLQCIAKDAKDAKSLERGREVEEYQNNNRNESESWFFTDR